MRLVALISQSPRDLQRGVLGAGNIEAVHAIKLKTAVGAGEVHTGHDSAAVVTNRHRNARPAGFTKTMGHHITHLTGLAYTRRKTRLIQWGVLRERLPVLPVGKIRQRGSLCNGGHDF